MVSGVLRLKQTDWTAEDVVKNFEHVMTSVKRATGNLSVKEGGKASVGSHCTSHRSFGSGPWGAHSFVFRSGADYESDAQRDAGTGGQNSQFLS